SFFFSSRRRHTRSDRDWSSDVCSSDLELLDARGVEVRGDDADLCGEWPIGQLREILLLQHSSGTTGLQKGVALSHEAVLNQLGRSEERRVGKECTARWWQ